MIRPLAAILILAATGCGTPPKPPAIGAGVGYGIGKIEAANNAAGQATRRLDPFVKPAGKPLVGVIEDAHAAVDEGASQAKAQLAIAETNAASLYGHVLDEKENTAAAKRNEAVAKQELKDERGHWVGYQLRLWSKIIIGGAAGLIVAYAIVAHFTGLPGILTLLTRTASGVKGAIFK